MTWADQSIDVRDRLDRLMSDGLRGLVIVFVMLALFLDLKIACQCEVGSTADLFATAHRLLRERPADGVAWYAAGLYYRLVGRTEDARRYFLYLCRARPAR